MDGEWMNRWKKDEGTGKKGSRKIGRKESSKYTFQKVKYIILT